MQVLRQIPEQASSPCVLTIGNFDGLHRGHQALLERLMARAQALALPAAVMTFEPHPREYFAPERAPARLSTLREKLALLAGFGIERVHACRFDRHLASLSAAEFIERLLVRGLAVRHLFVGDDFQFGNNRQGNFQLLQEAGRQHGFSVESLPTVEWQGERVSSSGIRTLLAAGDMEHAARLLGRPYSICGRVAHGRKLGREIGFPTANIHLRRRQTPLSGIFAVEVMGLSGDPQQGLPGAASLGTRPTIADNLQPMLEVHLLDFERNIYGQRVEVRFHHKIRDELRFDSLPELTARIAQDVSEVRNYFQSRHHG